MESEGIKGDVKGVPRGYPRGLKGPLMICKAIKGLTSLG